LHELPILPIDAETAGALTCQHSDPFDRMLIAQARRPSVTLATADAAIRDVGTIAQMWAG
jgi:PIN domain nuclease of toxin-antitoxin system